MTTLDQLNNASAFLRDRGQGFDARLGATPANSAINALPSGQVYAGGGTGSYGSGVHPALSRFETTGVSTPSQGNEFLPPQEKPESNWLNDGSGSDFFRYLSMLGANIGATDPRANQMTRAGQAFGQTGMQYQDVLADRATQAREADMQEQLLGLKKIQAAAQWKKAMQGTETNLIKNLTSAGFTPGTPEFQKAMQEQLASDGNRGEFLRAMETAGIDPTSVEGKKLLRDRMDKLTHIGESEAAQIISAMNKGTSKYEEEYGKSRGGIDAETVQRGHQAYRSLDPLEVMEITTASLDYTGAGSTLINEVKVMGETIASEFGFKLPDEFRSNPDFAFDQSMQNKFVSAMLKTEMGARPSDKDLAFLVSTLPNMGMTKASNQKIINHFRERLLVDMEDSMEVLAGRIEDKVASGGDEREYNRQLENYNLTLEKVLRKALNEKDLDGGYKPSPKMKSMLNRYRKTLEKQLQEGQ